VAIALIVVGLSGSDRAQQQRLLQWVAQGRIHGAFAHSNQTAGPGMAVMTPVYLAARPFASVSLSYVAASIACLVPLVVATVAATRASGIAVRSPRELLALALVVGGVPTLANYLEIFHPADVLGTAAVLGAYTAVLRRRIGWAAVLLGFGLATKQWVILAIAVLAILERGRDRAVLVFGSLGVFAVIIAPFAVADPHLTVATLAAKDVVRSSRALPGVIPLGETGTFLVSRYLPLVLVFVLCWWLRDRDARATPVVALTALGTALGLRAAVDTAGYGYYAAPGYAALVIALVVVVRPTRLVATAGAILAGGGLLWLRLAVFDWPTVVMRAVRGQDLPDQIIDHRSLPWATVASVLLFAVPGTCAVLLERATRATRATPTGPDGADVGTTTPSVPERADPGGSPSVSG
jgi:hypothetical protein